VPFFFLNMKRYYLPITITEQNVAVPLLVVTNCWYKWFDNGTSAKRAVPPVSSPRDLCRGWKRRGPNDFTERSMPGTYVEIVPGYVCDALRRLKRSLNWQSVPFQTTLAVFTYMIIAPIDYVRLKTNHKIGAPKGRLP
jgi:hypothetical protein